jgi:hypothetical protein
VWIGRVLIECLDGSLPCVLAGSDGGSESCASAKVPPASIWNTTRVDYWRMDSDWGGVGADPGFSSVVGLE